MRTALKHYNTLLYLYYFLWLITNIHNQYRINLTTAVFLGFFEEGPCQVYPQMVLCSFLSMTVSL
jgi:hypothetical protein